MTPKVQMWINITERLFERRESLVKHRLTPRQLIILAKASSPECSFEALRQDLDISAASLSRSLRVLQNDGLVTKTADMGKYGALIVEITGKGLKFLTRLDAVITQEMEFMK